MDTVLLILLAVWLLIEGFGYAWRACHKAPVRTFTPTEGYVYTELHPSLRNRPVNPGTDLRSESAEAWLNEVDGEE